MVMARRRHRIMIVDDHKIVRQGLRNLLEEPEDFQVVGDTDGASALARAMELKPQVILMDLRIPEFEDGMRLLTHLRENVPESRLLALTSPGLDANLVYRAIHSGA